MRERNVMAKWREEKANFRGRYKADTAEVKFIYVKAKLLVKIPRVKEFYLQLRDNNQNLRCTQL